jgi:hypothetical protein
MRFTIDIDITDRTKKAIKWMVLPFAVFAGTVAVAHATLTPDPNVWAVSKAPVLAANLRDNLNQLDGRLSAVEASKPGAARAWVNARCVASGCTVNSSFNVNPVIERLGVGDYRITFATPFSDGNYASVATSISGMAIIATNTPSNVRVESLNSSGAVDGDFSLVIYR